MSDGSQRGDGGNGAGIPEPIPVNIEDEVRSSFLDYSMSVIVSRALPDVRDGLKPVHRRILYAMNDEGLLPNRPYVKSAGVVGEVIKHYHPHGDAPYRAVAAAQAETADGAEAEPIGSATELLTRVLALGERGLSIQRYKGLGEMNPDQLAETTMQPHSRTLLQVKIEDTVEANLVISTLMGEEVEPRREFIEENALKVQNLDV